MRELFGKTPNDRRAGMNLIFYIYTFYEDLRRLFFLHILSDGQQTDLSSFGDF